MNSMTSTTDSTIDRPVITHPIWCVRGTSDEAVTYDRDGQCLATAEPANDLEHRSNPYHLDAGEALDTITVRAVQMYDLDDARQIPLGGITHVQVAIEMRELVGHADAHLTVGNVDRLIEMLQRVKRDIDLGEWHAGADRG